MVKNRRVKKSNSKIFKRLLECLINGHHEHMLKFTNPECTEFEVFLRDKKNKKEWSDKDISLFAELDSVSPRCRNAKKFAEETKGRFKSNMTKLINSERLELLSTDKPTKSLTILKYRILKFPNEVVMERGRLDQVFSNQGSPAEAYTTSHYSYLSGTSSQGFGEGNNIPNVSSDKFNHSMTEVNNSGFGEGNNIPNVSKGTFNHSMTEVNSSGFGEGNNIHNVSKGTFDHSMTEENNSTFSCHLSPAFCQNSEFENMYMDIPDFGVLDATLFDVKDDNLKDSGDPLLSSTVQSDKNTGLSPTYMWQNEYFQSVENISDVY